MRNRLESLFECCLSSTLEGDSRMSSVNLKEEVSASVRHFNTAPPDFNPETDLPPGFMAFLLPVHQELTSRQQLLARKRATVLSAAHQGQKPNYLPPSEAT